MIVNVIVGQFVVLCVCLIILIFALGFQIGRSVTITKITNKFKK